MHPIFQRRVHLAIYLAAWTPVLAVVAYASRPSPASSWPQAAAVLSPAMLIFAFACLSAWWVCRVSPLHPSEWARLAFTWTFASLCAGALLSGVAWLSAGLARSSVPNLPLLTGLGTILYLL